MSDYQKIYGISQRNAELHSILDSKSLSAKFNLKRNKIWNHWENKTLNGHHVPAYSPDPNTWTHVQQKKNRI